MKSSSLLLILAGACLSIVRFVMIRNFIVILSDEEVVIVLVTFTFFVDFLSVVAYLFDSHKRRSNGYSWPGPFCI